MVKDARSLSFNLDRPVVPFFFAPEAQHDLFPNAPSLENDSSHFLNDAVILTRPGVRISLATLREALASVDPNLPLISAVSLKEQVSGQLRHERLLARLTSGFGMLSLILASIGLYGLTAYGVASRTAEIGVRIALGANRSNVVSLILRSVFPLILLGFFFGIPLALTAGRLLENQLYGENPNDPLVLLKAVAYLGLCAISAVLIPAIRATFVSPSARAARRLTK